MDSEYDVYASFVDITHATQTVSVPLMLCKRKTTFPLDFFTKDKHN